jgi:hypothetical protein
VIDFTGMMGIVLLLMSIFYLLGIVQFPTMALLGFSLAALFLTIADSIHIKDNNKQRIKNLSFKEKMYYCAALCFVVLPFTSFKIPDYIIVKINDLSVLLSLGIVLLVTSKKNQHKGIEIKTDEHKGV